MGGGSIALAVAEALPSCNLILNDLHPNIAALWRVIADGQDLPRLQDWVTSVQPSTELFEQLRDTPHASDLERACIALYLNRTADGRTTGMRPRRKNHDERWYPKRHVQELQRAHELLRGRTQVLQAQFWNVPWADRVYLDPPYVKEGAGLYALGDWTDEHEMLQQHLQGREGWVLSYDDHPYIRDLFSCATIREVPVHYTTSGHADKVELIITP